MSKEEILKIIIENLLDVIPEIASEDITRSDSLKDLGANSIDRADIIEMTLESLSLNIPLTELGAAGNIGELVDLFHAKV